MAENRKQVWTIGVDGEQALMLVCLANIWRPGGSGYVLDVADKKHFNKIGTYQHFQCYGHRRIRGAE
jgi:hypothetical protein